jgi:hypothetical protein
LFPGARPANAGHTRPLPMHGGAGQTSAASAHCVCACRGRRVRACASSLLLRAFHAFFLLLTICGRPRSWAWRPSTAGCRRGTSWTTRTGPSNRRAAGRTWLWVGKRRFFPFPWLGEAKCESETTTRPQRFCLTLEISTFVSRRRQGARRSTRRTEPMHDRRRHAPAAGSPSPGWLEPFQMDGEEPLVRFFFVERGERATPARENICAVACLCCRAGGPAVRVATPAHARVHTARARPVLSAGAQTRGRGGWPAGRLHTHEVCRARVCLSARPRSPPLSLHLIRLPGKKKKKNPPPHSCPPRPRRPSLPWTLAQTRARSRAGAAPGPPRRATACWSTAAAAAAARARPAGRRRRAGKPPRWRPCARRPRTLKPRCVEVGSGRPCLRGWRPQCVGAWPGGGAR